MTSLNLIDLLAEDPMTGDLIPGTGGVLKLRVASSGRGKRGGARIIYYYLDEMMPIYLLLALCEDRENPSDASRETRGIGFGGCARDHAEGDDMSTFGDDLILSRNEALAHARGDGPAIVHALVTPPNVRRKVNLTQA